MPYSRLKLPVFIAAKNEQGDYSFRIDDIMGDYLILRDPKQEVVYYDTKMEKFLSDKCEPLDLVPKDPKMYRLERKQ